MTATPDTRKPVHKLTAADLATFPIWEYALDEETEEGRDETWVRPVVAGEVPTDAYSLSVACELTFQDGTKHDGLVGVTTEGSVDVSVGVLLDDDRYLFICTPSRGEDESARFLQAVGRVRDAVFPIRYRLRVRISGEQEFRTGLFA